jgi:hypothetical protein
LEPLVFNGLNVAPFIPLALRGVRESDPEELAAELAEGLAEYLVEPADRERVAKVLGLVSFRLSGGSTKSEGV